jgi:hypothetical protein
VRLQLTLALCLLSCDQQQCPGGCPTQTTLVRRIPPHNALAAASFIADCVGNSDERSRVEDCQRTAEQLFGRPLARVRVGREWVDCGSVTASVPSAVQACAREMAGVAPEGTP